MYVHIQWMRMPGWGMGEGTTMSDGRGLDYILWYVYTHVVCEMK